ncbi:MAG: hypothetical protein M0P57_11595 [Syntrophales bacterium]|jgi:tRNA 2-thiocytidine biosynthesis protein TtcA|nr:hypothetical protein [Syntrophales bacterium]
MKKTKLYLHLKKWLEIAASEYSMIKKNDRVLICVSGGLDSDVLLDLLLSPMLYLPEFESVAFHVDLGFDPQHEGLTVLDNFLESKGCEYYLEKTDIGPLAHSIKNRKNPCFLCSRIRRKHIFEAAEKYGCNKIAFAHHKDDMIETLLINMFYGREISTMVPNQPVFGGKYHLIRPLAYITEKLVKKYAGESNFPYIQNKCPTEPVSKRAYVKKLLDYIEKDNKNVRENIFKSMRHVKPDYLLRPEMTLTDEVEAAAER